jgi:phosphoglycolate phosphatase
LEREDFCDVDPGIEIMNGLLHQCGLHLLTRLPYRDLFIFPAQAYYTRLGFDFAKEPLEVVGKLWMDEYELRKIECGPSEGTGGVLDSIRQLGIGESTVKKHLLEIFEKLAVETRSAATLRALEMPGSPAANR